jgi:sugar O-acyltransferase (sialic acid O-acetyltransferase NeuD family)
LNVSSDRLLGQDRLGSATLWLVGAGGHGAVVAEAALASGWQDVVFFDDRWPELTESRGWPVLGDRERLLQSFNNSTRRPAGVLVAIGDNERRLVITDQLLQAGAPVATVIHPFSSVSPSAEIGIGCAVLAGSVLNAGVRIGRASIVNTRASIDHDSEIGEGVHICPGATLAGTVRVGPRAWLGIGSCIIQNISIGSDVFVAAGATVVGDVPDRGRVAGCPARPIRRPA